MGSHAEACDPHSGDIWDIHTFIANAKLQGIFAMMTPPVSESEMSPDLEGTPRIGGARVTFQEPECESNSPGFGLTADILVPKSVNRNQELSRVISTT